jgi:two-component system, NarL family, response regulator NreC
MSMKRVTVLIADNHRNLLKVIHDFLDQLPNVSVVGEARNGDDAVKKVKRLIPDFVLMDISMPQMNGLEATRIIKQRWPDTKVLLSSTFDDPIYRREALNVKADGYILKESLVPSLEAFFALQR